MTDHDVFTGVHVVHINPDTTVSDTGLVVSWRRRGNVWEALVTREVSGSITTEWLPALVLAQQERVASVPALEAC